MKVNTNKNIEENNKSTTESTTTKKKPWYKKWYYITLLVTLVVVGIFNLFGIVTVVRGNSMYPNFHDGNMMIASRKYDIWRYDVVLIANEKTKLTIIKRVIGLPNETVEFKDNVLYINGNPKEDLYAYGNTEDFKITLKDNEFFCLGDNREDSMDSRVFGPFTDKDIYAKTNYKIYPNNDKK